MKNENREYLPHSTGCFLCGEDNLAGARARFFVVENEVRGAITIPGHMNGYKDIAHGGIVAALLDETMGWAATVFGKTHTMFVTAELTVRYILPAPVEKEISVRSRLVRDTDRLSYCEGEILFGDTMCARGKGTFAPLDRAGMAEVLPYLKFHDCGKFRNLFDGYR